MPPNTIGSVLEQIDLEGLGSLPRTEKETYAQVDDDAGPDCGDGASGRAAALAHDQLIQCRAIPCYGSGNDDKILERIGNGKSDKIIPKGAHDLILANAYTNDIDVVTGSKGWDKIKVNDGDTLDTAAGGRGTHDWCFVDSRREVGPGCNRVTVR